MPPRASFETKLKVARAVADGKGWKEASDIGGVSRMTAWRWNAEQDDEWLAAVEAIEQHDAATEPDLPEVFAGDRGGIIVAPMSINSAMNEAIRAGAKRVT